MWEVYWLPLSSEGVLVCVWFVGFWLKFFCVCACVYGFVLVFCWVWFGFYFVTVCINFVMMFFIRKALFIHILLCFNSDPSSHRRWPGWTYYQQSFLLFLHLSPRLLPSYMSLISLRGNQCACTDQGRKYISV